MAQFLVLRVHVVPATVWAYFECVSRSSQATKGNVNGNFQPQTKVVEENV